MIHTTWTGTHYDAGKNYGSQLFEIGINPMKHIPISEERAEYVKQSIPIYERYFPEIIQEITGIAGGMHIPFIDLANFLFSMYCFVFHNKCSCFAFTYQDQVIFGRNSDFLISVEDSCQSALYNLNDTNSFIGNTTAWTEMEDGVNQYGLAVGLTFIYPILIHPGFNAGMLVRYLLETCKTTEEAIYALNFLPIGSPQTITLADASGELAVVECNCEKIVVRKPQDGHPYVYTTNHFNAFEMQKYQYIGADDSFSRKRFDTLTHAFQAKPDQPLQFATDLLSGKKGFLCQYDRSQGLDTVWSSIYNLTDHQIYRCEGNPSRDSYQLDTRLQFA